MNEQLPLHSGPRLRRVARAIVEHQEAWDQETWGYSHETQFNIKPQDIAGCGDTNICGSTFCAAGWAIRFTPDQDIGLLRTILDATSTDRDAAWHAGGRYALGLEEDLAQVIFHGADDWTAQQMADILNATAELSEGWRNATELRALILGAGRNDLENLIVIAAEDMGFELEEID